MPESKSKTFTEAQEKRVLKMYADGAYVKEIARAFDVYPIVVKSTLKRHGVEVDSDRWQRITPEMEKQALVLYAESKSWDEIAQTLEISRAALYKILTKHGVIQKREPVVVAPSKKRAAKPLIKRKTHSDASTVQEAIALYVSGVGCEEVATHFRVTSGTILRWVRDAGFEVRPAGFQRGGEHHGWRGGRVQNQDGYVLALQRPEDPFYSMASIKTRDSRYVLEHRLVMAQKLGRPLRRSETVHHIDGDRANNSPDNLQLRQGRHGNGVALCCAQCGSTDLIPVDLH
jgi:transposase-like protein